MVQTRLWKPNVLLGLLPLACALVVARTRYRVACTRTLQPVRVQAGEQARILLNLTNVSRIPTGLLLVEDKIPYVLGGAIVVEQVFNWPGMGRLFVDSIGYRDYPVLMGLLMLTALLVVIGNLVADLVYAAVDPRVRLS